MRLILLLLTFILAVCNPAFADAPMYPVRKAGKAQDVAKRNKINVDDFCRWNLLDPDEVLETGYEVYLQNPDPARQSGRNLGKNTSETRQNSQSVKQDIHQGGFIMPAAETTVHTRRQDKAADPLMALYDDGSIPPASSYPGYVSNKKVPMSAKEQKALKLANEHRDKPIQPFMTANGRVTYVFGATLPSIICSPFMACDVELGSGENVNDVVVGDTARWKVVMAKSGRSGAETPHIVFKPMDAGLETMAVITTDRRTYHLKMLSQPKGHMPYVGFSYPEEEDQKLRSQVRGQQKAKELAALAAPASGIDPAHLNFNYEISGKAPWKPVQVYSDNRQTFIRLPDSASNSEIPVLLVRREGADVMVNYRVKDGALVVDEIFQEAVLLAGVGSKQQRVTIKKKGK